VLARLVNKRHGRVSNIKKVDELLATHGAVSSDKNFRLGINHTTGKSLSTEPAEHYGMHRANTCARKHGNRKLGHHGQVDGHVVALANTLGLEHVGKTLHLVEQLSVGVFNALGRLVAFPVEGNRVALAVEHVAVQRIVSKICLAPEKPLDGHGALCIVKIHVVQSVPALFPVEFVADLGPERLHPPPYVNPTSSQRHTNSLVYEANSVAHTPLDRWSK